MERDIFDLGKNIVSGIFSGSTFLNIIVIIGISVAGIFLKSLLEILKRKNPKLANAVAGILLLFVLYLVISEFQGKGTVATEENKDEVPTMAVDSTNAVNTTVATDSTSN